MRRPLPGSFDASSNRRRRSTIGTTLPRRFITPSMKAGAFGSRRDLIGRPGDLVHRGDRQPVFLVAKPEDDELLVGHRVSIRLALPDLVAIALLERTRRTRSERNRRSGDSTATRRLPWSSRQIDVISASPAPRVSRAGAGSIRPGSMRMISRVRSATMPTAPLPIDRTTTLPRSSRSRSLGNPEQRAQRHQRQQPVAQRHDAQHGRFGTRNLATHDPGAE